MASAKGTRYSLTLPPAVDQDLTMLSESLGITKAEALRRAIVLYKHAITADKVELHDKNGTQTVLLK